MLKKRSGLVVLALVSLYAFACRQLDTVVKDLDKGKLTWQWQSQGKDDQASEFRIRCGTVSGKYDLPIVRVPFPNLEVPIKQVATKPGRYFCVVTAANEFGESSPSNEISFKIDTKK
ncbi:MAG: hypothetical protein ACREQA_23470 [Candidatus Binatia bacterium]